MPLGTLTAAELGRGKVLVVTFASNSGSETHTFAPKNLGMPNGTGWVTAIEQARAAAGSDPAPSAAEPPPEPAPGTDPDAPTSTIPEHTPAGRTDRRTVHRSAATVLVTQHALSPSLVASTVGTIRGGTCGDGGRTFD